MEENKYHFGREIIYNLRSCGAISAKVYLHWLNKLNEDELLDTKNNVNNVSNVSNVNKVLSISFKEEIKVKYRGNNGFECQKEHAEKYLKIGETYTVLNTILSSFNTDVVLKEFPNLIFNYACFEECKK